MNTDYLHASWAAEIDNLAAYWTDLGGPGEENCLETDIACEAVSILQKIYYTTHDI